MNLINKEIAKRSLIYHNNILSLPDIINRFKKCGVIDVSYWSLSQLSLIQCSNEQNINATLRQMKTIDSIDFRMMRENGNIRKVLPSKIDDAIKFLKSKIHFREINKCSSTLFNQLNEASSISEQLKMFYDFYSMSEYDIRLRYCYAMNIERCIQHIIPTATIELFGSSTTGLGKFNSDLDLKIIVQEMHVNDAVKVLRRMSRYLRSVNRGMLNHVVYNCRFPICHYYDSLLGMTVDISILHDTVLDTSRILKFLSDNFSYFGPLCIVIKQIYIHEGLLVPRPNTYFTGFKIVSLLIHFLQSRRLLPPLSSVTSKPDSTINVDISILLLEFFQYLIEFDPLQYDIDLGNGSLSPKIGKDFLTCISHLDRSLNITRHIRRKEWDEFRVINMNILNTLSENNSEHYLWGLGKFLFGDNTVNVELPNIMNINK